jgi:hypothetical protein
MIQSFLFLLESRILQMRPRLKSSKHPTRATTCLTQREWRKLVWVRIALCSMTLIRWVIVLQKEFVMLKKEKRALVYDRKSSKHCSSRTMTHSTWMKESWLLGMHRLLLLLHSLMRCSFTFELLGIGESWRWVATLIRWWNLVSWVRIALLLLLHSLMQCSFTFELLGIGESWQWVATLIRWWRSLWCQKKREGLSFSGAASLGG